MNTQTEFFEPLHIRTEALTIAEQVLHERAICEARKYLRFEADLLETISAVDACRLYLKFELNSTFAYCTEILKLSPATTFNFINVARKSQEVPELREAVRSGQLSVATARKIVPVINKENQQSWLDKAKGLPQKTLEREVANAAPESVDFERVKPVRNNRVRMELSFSEEAMTEIRRLQDLVSAKKKRNASYEDTFLLAIRNYLERHDPICRARRSEKHKAKTASSNSQSTSEEIRKQKSVKAEVVTDPNSGENKNSGEDKTAKPGTGMSNIQNHLSQTAGHASKGGNTRYIPAEVQHAVNLRDGGKCQAVFGNGRKCRRTRYLQFHHKIPIALAGQSTLDNLVTLCSCCHKTWHIQEFKKQEIK